MERNGQTTGYKESTVEVGPEGVYFMVQNPRATLLFSWQVDNTGPETLTVQPGVALASLSRDPEGTEFIEVGSPVSIPSGDSDHRAESKQGCTSGVYLEASATTTATVRVLSSR